MSDDLSCLRGMFKEQKEFIGYRFDELHKDLDEQKKEQKEINSRQDEAIEVLKDRKWRDRTYSALGGVVGGYLAFLTTQAKRFFNGSG